MIYGKPINEGTPHVRMVSAVWNTSTKSLPSQQAIGVRDHAISGIVLVYDTIASEYKVYWGTFAHHNPTSSGLDSILEQAQHIASWGCKFPMAAAQVLFGDLSKPPNFADTEEVS